MSKLQMVFIWESLKMRDSFLFLFDHNPFLRHVRYSDLCCAEFFAKIVLVNQVCIKTKTWGKKQFSIE